MRPRRSASSHSAGRIQSLAGGRRVALVEDEVDHLEHRRRGGRRARRGRGHLERHARLGQRALGAHDALRHRRLGDQEGAGDLRRSSGRRAGAASARRAPRRQHRVAGDEDQPQQVVAARRRPAASRSGSSSCCERPALAADLLVLALERAARGAARRCARCLAVAMSQAPGLSGTPDSGHCSSAATSASWARSSASADVARRSGSARR